MVRSGVVLPWDKNQIFVAFTDPVVIRRGKVATDGSVSSRREGILRTTREAVGSRCAGEDAQKGFVERPDLVRKGRTGDTIEFDARRSNDEAPASTVTRFAEEPKGISRLRQQPRPVEVSGNGNRRER